MTVIIVYQGFERVRQFNLSRKIVACYASLTKTFRESRVSKT